MTGADRTGSASPRDLPAWLAHIESLHSREIDMGLPRIREVAMRLSLLPWTGPVVTVAGTNGKGSTVALLHALASAAGYRTGVYTSPHILRFNERVQIAGQPADDASLCEAFAVVEQARGETPLTYFEFSTLAALWLFRAAEPDLLILEVGLGGRLDAVNLVDPTVAVITSVGLDHMDWLGDTREAIATEKAGIRRPGVPLLYGEEDMPAVVAELAAADQVPLLRAGQVFGSRETGLATDQSLAREAAGAEIWWQQAGQVRRLATPPVWLGADNLATATQALAVLDMLPPEPMIQRVAGELRLPGRCQHLRCNGIDWYLDVGHNQEAMTRFLGRLPPARPGSSTLAVCAMLADKRPQALLPFRDQVTRWFLADLPPPRGGQGEHLQSALGDAAVSDVYATVEAAVQAAAEAALPGDRVLVFGSFFTVAAAQPVIDSMPGQG
ncbi:bifunctional folylpolyglutamate synthase/dihydrofolate synthase [Alcanivorax sp. JB21]|uniref:bifunctional folylpolyglutamate synthase/dihydrofolate synthase n=1 Tax=Alcanivorax limicola TaxID=2874102 RepID=UPI001CC0B2AE|nr:folylpolyglutamate synthase/dihydrofolate synthase family protein [Alcanivorax limicola]MBZ2187677.1 bifunctional folylpolyglutamate synthase/dihydrofolate synthase [Alcanivorax limicola]